MDKPTGSKPRRFRPGIYGLVCTAWICCVCLPVILQIEHDRGVQHFSALLFLLPFGAMAVCTLIGLCVGLWRTVRGPHRKRGVLLFAVASMPLVFWTAAGVFAYSAWSRRQKPNTFLMQVARRGGASVMDAELYARYPHTIARRRFTMF